MNNQLLETIELGFRPVGGPAGWFGAQHMFLVRRLDGEIVASASGFPEVGNGAFAALHSGENNSSFGHLRTQITNSPYQDSYDEEYFRSDESKRTDKLLTRMGFVTYGGNYVARVG